MSENVFGQCATLIGRAAIQKIFWQFQPPPKVIPAKLWLPIRMEALSGGIRYFLMMNSSLCSSMQILLPELLMHPERF